MKYEHAKKIAFAKCIVDDGYNGATVAARLSFDQTSGAVLVVCDCGYSRSFLPLASCENEARRLVAQSPLAKKYFRDLEFIS